jgi:hypothetical protein
VDGSSETPSPSLTTQEWRGLKLAAVSMIRNESDLILPFLRQCAELFDEILVADIQSTDGTRAALRGFADPRLRVHVYDVDRQEKYQSALMNSLSREAFSRGADWVFFLDADEFLDVADRSELEAYLQEVGSDVLMAPWVNLVPSHYGSYRSFDTTQTFFWSGRTSSYTKVAISSLFAANNPDYYIAEGSHSVSAEPTAHPIGDRPGLPILHVPIRSLDRFKLKIGSARRLTLAKHNRLQHEGVHVEVIDDMLAVGSVEPAELNFIAGNYGELMEGKRTLDPVELGWPVRRLPDYVNEPSDGPSTWQGHFAGLSETLRADSETVWDQTEFVKGTAVSALIDGERIRIAPQPQRGSGRFLPGRFSALPPAQVTERTPEELLIDVVSISTMRVKAHAFSAWSELIPVMYALFTVLQPRRFVELGVHNGMSYFAGCQVAERLDLNTQCVAVDSWVGDEHAGFHSTEVFDEFRRHLKENYPDQVFIQALFKAALNCFEDGSIDLLHIDGLHTYQAVKQDFEAWLPKMSDAGVIIFHDINVFERDFAVWRLWSELRETYPSFAFAHKHGLGIIYVGREPHPVAALLRLLAGNRHHTTLVQAWFEGIGTLLIEHRENSAALEQATLQSMPDVGSGKAALPRNVAELQSRLIQLQDEYDTIIHSTSWRAAAPIRKLLDGQPALRRFARRVVKAGWWTATGQLPQRLRERRAIQSAISQQGAPAAQAQA